MHLKTMSLVLKIKEDFFDDIRSKIILCIVLVIITLIPYWQVQYHDFINFDDGVYITENRNIQEGLSLKGLSWAFSTTNVGFWHPLTWISLMIDKEFFNLNPGGYHWTNLLLHLTNTLLLFIILHRVTGAALKSGFVAALFALHPLHVESVAWIAERKDVLSTFFWMLTMGAYVFYTERPSIARYLFVIMGLLFGLMSKPMLVTLPYALLLIDFWPLKRMNARKAGFMLEAQGIDEGAIFEKKRPLRSISFLLLEKIPFIMATIPFMWLSIVSQKKYGGVTSFADLSFFNRISNALTSYIWYITKTFWPQGLAFYYPHPGPRPLWQPLLSAAALAFISLLIIRAMRRYPYLLTGWLWYLGTLVPVIGLVQIGYFSRADRYTYIPLIGLFILITWLVSETVNRWRNGRLMLSGISCSVIVILMVTTWHQVGYWRNDLTLSSHALRVTRDNYKAHQMAGMAYFGQGDDLKAERHLKESIGIMPEAGSLNNLGLLYVRQKQFDQAEHQFKSALRIKPDHIDSLNNLGVLLASRGRRSEAIKLFQEVLLLNPENDRARKILVFLRQTEAGEKGAK